MSDLQQPVFLEVLAGPPAQFATSTPTPPIAFDGPQRYSDELTSRLAAEAADIIGRYPQSRSALLPLLHLVQSVDGYITRAGVTFCAEQLGLTAAQVASVATFYSMYRREPTGEYLIGVCTNTLCAVLGGDEILASLTEHLGVEPGGTTADGRITVEHVECNAACDFAPVVMVNWEFYDNQTPTSATELAEDLRAGIAPPPSRGSTTLCSFRQTARLLAGLPPATSSDDGSAPA
ncbi:NADH-quinone oxidoreductase subunit NuoE [Gordonia sp. TBRC 11910]|uniref:NADH-quinone oxidoreductase subunit NuoE n=1 Tax=Gordonia asplenii TaxID=2725283 RepID=A0A848L007_9ACTN|nr:NADH-quinone oxidoreductase subunit NuoE [Gordonia asplenii]NMO03802.1 NADH-quinone oxidoreductase subunit NuoE [Gordonia asplenii]